MSAIYLSEYAASRVRDILKPSLELLAGIPTIVYGFFAVTFIRPDVLKPIFSGIGPFSALAAGIAVGIMTIPLVASLSEDAMRAVPRSLREGGYALGATKLEVSWQIVVPAAISGIIASFILAMSRAVGETMIVALAAGSKPQLTANPLEPMQTMTGFIVQAFSGDVVVGTAAVPVPLCGRAAALCHDPRAQSGQPLGRCAGSGRPTSERADDIPASVRLPASRVEQPSNVAAAARQKPASFSGCSFW